MSLRRDLIFVLALLPASSLCQTAPGTVPAGTPIALAIDRNYPMRKGEPISAHLLYPIYADNQLLLPKDTVVTGSVVDLHSDRKRRVNAALGGDFTPFHIPEVHFEQIVWPMALNSHSPQAPQPTARRSIERSRRPRLRAASCAASSTPS